MAISVTINWRDGRHETVEDLDAAQDVVRAKYPTAYFFYEGARWLAWKNESESENDSGANAVAEFIVV